MTRYLLSRLGEMVAVMLAVSFLVYLALEVNAADVAVKVLGQFSTEDQRARWLVENGYDRPFLVRYVAWLWDFVNLRWGRSILFRDDVITILIPRLEKTAILAGLTFAAMVPASFILGILAGVREGSGMDRAISFFSVFTTSVPEYASAVLFSAIFVFGLGWLPGASTGTMGFAWKEMVLPVMVMAVYDVGYLARITRASMAEVMTAPYIRTALMKGASPARIVLRHALRNAMVAPITVIMLQIPWLVSGVIVVEVFFAYKGFGTLIYEACLNSDVALIEACAIVSVFIIVTTQFISDLIYTLLNPRIRASLGQATA